jgi:transcriptional regulator with XRE-family HTH domain
MTSLPILLHRLGQVIRILRKQTGLSQERFGFSIGVHRTYMGHLERGTANPTVKILHLVAQGLGIGVSDLFTAAMIEISGESPASRDRSSEPGLGPTGAAPGSPGRWKDPGPSGEGIGPKTKAGKAERLGMRWVREDRSRCEHDAGGSTHDQGGSGSQRCLRLTNTPSRRACTTRPRSSVITASASPTGMTSITWLTAGAPAGS